MVVKGDDDVLRKVSVVGMRGVKLGAGVDELWGVGVSCVFLRGTAGGGTCVFLFFFFIIKPAWSRDRNKPIGLLVRRCCVD